LFLKSTKPLSREVCRKTIFKNLNSIFEYIFVVKILTHVSTPSGSKLSTLEIAMFHAKTCRVVQPRETKRSWKSLKWKGQKQGNHKWVVHVPQTPIHSQTNLKNNNNKSHFKLQNQESEISIPFKTTTKLVLPFSKCMCWPLPITHIIHIHIHIHTYYSHAKSWSQLDLKTCPSSSSSSP